MHYVYCFSCKNDYSEEDFLESVKMLENEANDIFYQAEYDRIMNF